MKEVAVDDFHFSLEEEEDSNGRGENLIQLLNVAVFMILPGVELEGDRVGKDKVCKNTILAFEAFKINMSVKLSDPDQFLDKPFREFSMRPPPPRFPTHPSFFNNNTPVKKSMDKFDSPKK